MSAAIQTIDRGTVHRICSGQVVLTLASAVKELVENAIDAGASSIDVRLKEYGSEVIEVVDNGGGVEESNYQGLTLKHHTSKIQDFSDLVNVDTFGFRGEALSSLCALGCVSITTRHQSCTVAAKLDYDHHGNLIRQTPCARQVGTTVTISHLFSTLPVRHKEFLRNIKKEFNKMISVLNAYCIISVGLRITCSNQVGKGQKVQVLSVNANDSMKDNLTNLFGAKQFSSLMPFKQSHPSEAVSSEYGVQTHSDVFTIQGYVSKCQHGLGRSTTDRQFIFINKRPCDVIKISKVVNEVYHMYNRQQSPFVVLVISLNKDCVDVNVTPDKRQIFVDGEKLLLATIKSSLIEMYEPMSSSFELNQSVLALKPTAVHNSEENHSQKRSFQDFVQSQKNTISGALASLKRTFTSAFAKDGASRSSKKETNTKQRKLDTFFVSSTEQVVPSEIVELSSDSNPVLGESICIEDPVRTESSDVNLSQESANLELDAEKQEVKYSVIFESFKKTGGIVCDAKLEDVHELSGAKDSLLSATDNAAGDCLNDNQTDSSVPSKTPVNIGDVRNKTKYGHDEVDKRNIDFLLSGSPDKLCDNTGSKICEETKCDGLLSDEGGDVSMASTVYDSNSLSREESKGNYTSGSVASRDGCGQSRIALTQLDEAVDVFKKTVMVPFSMNSLKHKHQAEPCTLRKEGSHGLQRSFRARISPDENQSAEDELRKEISKDMFKKMEVLGQFNLGFIIVKLWNDLFIVDQHASDEKYNFEQLQKHTVIQNQKLIQPQKLELTVTNESVVLDNLDIFRTNGFEFKIDDEAPASHRIQLVSKPISKNWVFGKEDIDELIFMLSDSPGVMCRPSRVRQMFASRACRKSIMIGTALNQSQMYTLVRHMEDIDQPWNCPHGRPTMRHLINLDLLPSES